jgi:DNA helicase-2/ATP-dependent DNA helicase PcrA
MTSTLDGLNAQQRKAVEAKDGPTLIIAGPGSGKTRVLTSRVAYLLQVRDVFPYRIMAVTFTNKAAREMRERLNRLVGADKTGDLMLGTFHSICARILRREAHHASLDRSFTIYDADDQTNVVKAALQELNLDEKKYKPSSIHAAISTAKNELITPEAYKPDSYFNEIAGRVYVRYNAILRANNALDFDDLLMETVLLLQRNASVREKMQERYLHVLVDEFQDTNIAQYTLIKLITASIATCFVWAIPIKAFTSFAAQIIAMCFACARISRTCR